MDENHVEARNPAETIGDRVEKINTALAAYESWKKENNAVSYRAEIVEQTPAATLGERLTNAKEKLWGKANENLDPVLDAIKPSNEDGDEDRLMKLHQARELVKGFGIRSVEEAARTLKVLETRPDLLTDDELVDTLEKQLRQDVHVSEKVVKQILKIDDSSGQIAAEQFAVMEKIAAARPESDTSMVLGLATGVGAVNERFKTAPKTPSDVPRMDLDYSVLRAKDRKEDGYPLDIVAAASQSSPDGKVFPGLDTLKGLPKRTDLSKLNSRGLAVVLGATMALAMRAGESARGRHLSGVESSVATQFAKCLDALFPDQPLRLKTGEAGVNETLAEVTDRVVRSEGGGLFREFNDRELRIRDARRAREDENLRVEAERKAQEEATVAVVQQKLDAEAARLKAEEVVAQQAEQLKAESGQMSGKGGGGLFRRFFGDRKK